MLFGNEDIQKIILKDAEEFAKKYDVKIIYGAIVGSISKGLQQYGSDYDTRFLFIKKDFPEHIYMPGTLKENEIILRYYPEKKEGNGGKYERIPLWEFSSFLQFLVNPYIDQYSPGLYNLINVTFASPYNWDPYGLSNKLLPLINHIFREDIELQYHLQVLKDLKTKIDEMRTNISSRDYLYAIHAAVSIEWILRYAENAPVYFPTLVTIIREKELLSQVKEIWKQERKASIEWYKKASSTLENFTGIFVPFSRNRIIDDYLSKMEKQCKEYLSKANAFDPKQLESHKKLIDQMYEVSLYSIRDEVVMPDINDKCMPIMERKYEG